eukprot:m.261548 g.261548  ORF g.261548 m.261548 type:complete len:495 (+) comp45182_c0_seq1:81-1565(+)
MVFSRFVEVGRVILVCHGFHSGKLAVIVNVVDATRILIDGPYTGICRRVIHIKRVLLTDIKINIPFNARRSKVEAAFSEAGVLEKWQRTAWANKADRRKKRSNLTDFERFAVRVQKHERRHAYREEVTRRRVAGGQGSAAEIDKAIRRCYMDMDRNHISNMRIYTNSDITGRRTVPKTSHDARQVCLLCGRTQTILAKSHWVQEKILTRIDQNVRHLDPAQDGEIEEHVDSRHGTFAAHLFCKLDGENFCEDRFSILENAGLDWRIEDKLVFPKEMYTDDTKMKVLIQGDGTTSADSAELQAFFAMSLWRAWLAQLPATHTDMRLLLKFRRYIKQCCEGKPSGNAVLPIMNLQVFVDTRRSLQMSRAEYVKINDAQKTAVNEENRRAFIEYSARARNVCLWTRSWLQVGHVHFFLKSPDSSWNALSSRNVYEMEIQIRQELSGSNGRMVTYHDMGRKSANQLFNTYRLHLMHCSSVHGDKILDSALDSSSIERL